MASAPHALLQPRPTAASGSHPSEGWIATRKESRSHILAVGVGKDVQIDFILLSQGANGANIGGSNEHSKEHLHSYQRPAKSQKPELCAQASKEDPVQQAVDRYTARVPIQRESCEYCYGSPSEGFFHLWNVRCGSVIRDTCNLPRQSSMEAHSDQCHPNLESDHVRRLRRTQRGLSLVLPGSAPLPGCKQA